MSRGLLAGAAFAMALALPGTALSQSALLPAGIFDMKVTPGQGSSAVEADRLVYNAGTGVIEADGNVVLNYQGTLLRAEKVVFNQRTGQLFAEGNVYVREPNGVVYEMDRLDMTGGMKEAFVNSLTLTTANGTRVTAREATYEAELTTILIEGSYSPCGLCVDEKGRRIGWQVKSARMIYDKPNASLIVEQPTLEFLGAPVAWLPWFWMPDPSQPRATGPRMPSVDYSDKLGVELTVPYFMGVGPDIDILLSPRLMSRQGVLAHGGLTWRLPEWRGTVDIKASGLYQLDPGAFHPVGQKDWRGAIQTSGEFKPVDEWTVGWSYTAFTDNAYLEDYGLTDSDTSVNQVYATHLSDSLWIDGRIQRFNRIGNYTSADEDRQGLNAPRISAAHIYDLEPGWGRINLRGDLASIIRAADQNATYNGVTYHTGLEGTKLHARVEAGWENQYILPGGVTATPFLGGRLDAASYDGASLNGPAASSLLSLTPIAAIDVRWPLMARTASSTHLFEPIAQLVYRGSSTTDVGITNDDAHSFVFDTSNLFSYNKFSGIDRQETGLRANIGAQYLGTFDNGSWLNLVAGQSFHLAGANAYDATDLVQVGASTGLNAAASHLVASARAGIAGGLSGAAKIQVDPSAWRVTRFGTGVSYAPASWFSLGADYIYLASDPALGITDDRQEAAARAKVVLADYYAVSGSVAWDIEAGSWTKATLGADYDDNYLAYGGAVNFTPTSWGFTFGLKLKGPDGEIAF